MRICRGCNPFAEGEPESLRMEFCIKCRCYTPHFDKKEVASSQSGREQSSGEDVKAPASATVRLWEKLAGD